MSFPAYTSYKDSEVEWLGPVPSHWSPTRLRFLTQLNPSKSEVSNLSPDTEVSFVPMEDIGESGELSREQTRPLSDVLTGYTYFREGDVSIAKITPCFENGKGAIMRGLSAGVGFGTTELIIARPRPDATTPEFLDWLFRSPAFRARGEAAMYGAGGQKRVPDDFVRDFMSPGAPLDEQVTIAAFLDREIAKIDALIEEQRHLIALLKEKRQAVISHAVTKGLDPHATLKSSGIEWLGDVPAHWEVRKLTAVAQLESGHTPSRQRPEYWIEEDCVIPWFTLADVGQLRGGRFLNISETTQRISEVGLENSSARLLPAGTVILSRTASVGFSGVTEIELAVSQDFAAWLCGAKLNANFLLLVLQAMRPEFVRLMMGSTHQTIYMPDISAFKTPLPPEDEQAEIVDHVATASTSIDVLTDDCEAAIRLLRERRAALISAAVTGKIDVRGSAKVLPFPIERARARRFVATEIIERLAHQPTFGRTKLQKVAYLAEAHASITELAGCYIRMPYGPLDQPMMDEIEANGGEDGIVIDDKRDGSMVRYRATGKKGGNNAGIRKWLGGDRYAKLDHLIKVLSGLKTHSAEAIATLYAVWNDALIEGRSPTDEQIISAFFGWHPKKGENFSSDELTHWLDWMRRHGIVPTGSGPKTMGQIGTLL